MDLFIKHELKKEHDDNVLILYLNQNQTEFASELGTIEKSNGSWQNTVQNYIKNNLPNIKVNTVKIMFGTFMVTSIAVNGGPVLAAPIETSKLKAEEKEKNKNYTVQSGDSLSVIAKRFSMTVGKLNRSITCILM